MTDDHVVNSGRRGITAQGMRCYRGRGCPKRDVVLEPLKKWSTGAFNVDGKISYYRRDEGEGFRMAWDLQEVGQLWVDLGCTPVGFLSVDHHWVDSGVYGLNLQGILLL